MPTLVRRSQDSNTKAKKQAIEFDYQWKNLSSPYVAHNEDRRKELLQSNCLHQDFFKGKYCLDAGCDNGRFTYAMLNSGASSSQY
jgi:hypothetical protein